MHTSEIATVIAVTPVALIPSPEDTVFTPASLPGIRVSAVPTLNAPEVPA